MLKNFPFQTCFFNLENNIYRTNIYLTDMKYIHKLTTEQTKIHKH